MGFGPLVTTPIVSPQALACALAARLLHDIAGPASGVVSGMELYADPGASHERDAALELVAASGKALLDSVRFCNAAYAGDDMPRDLEGLRSIVSTLFVRPRLTLDWRINDTPLTARACQGLLIMIQLALGGLPRDGFVTVTTTSTAESMVVEGKGDRAGIGPEVLLGLAGEPLTGGLAGRWAPAYYLYSIASSAGGVVTCTDRPGGFRLSANF